MQHYKKLVFILPMCFLLAGCSSHIKQPSKSSTSATSTVSETSVSSEIPISSEVSSTKETPSSKSSSKPSSKKDKVAYDDPPVLSTAPSKSASSKEAPVRKEVQVTIPEGLTFMNICNKLEEQGVCTKKEFYKTCQNYSPRSFSIPTSSNRCFKMEGYLFPDTYRFYKNDDPENVLIKMLNNYHAKAGNISSDTLILASIIQRETRSFGEMQKVSSVFHNRLKSWTYLDSDPTREYVNDNITGNPLVSNPHRYAALYNTYEKRKGLPAGPICNPGIQAIRAALHPANTNYYYFFFGNDDKNHYSCTLKQHEEAMKKYGVRYH